MCTCVCTCVRVCVYLGSPLSFCWSSEWVVCSRRRALETLYLHTRKHTHTSMRALARARTHTHTCPRAHTRTHRGETGNHTNAAQRRVEQAEAFIQMCDINLVDPKHGAVAPTHSPQCVCECVSVCTCKVFVLTFENIHTLLHTFAHSFSHILGTFFPWGWGLRTERA